MNIVWQGTMTWQAAVLFIKFCVVTRDLHSFFDVLHHRLSHNCVKILTHASGSRVLLIESQNASPTEQAIYWQLCMLTITAGDFFDGVFHVAFLLV